MARYDTRWPLITAFLITLLSIVAVSWGDPDSDVLLKFRASLGNDGALYNWNASTNPCTGNWVGVKCWNGTGKIWALQLEHMGLTGFLDLDTLRGLPYLRAMSFMNNSFTGPMPNIRKLKALKAFYFSNNRFSGDIPDDAFVGMGWLKKVHLANNDFTGKIPTSLQGLPRLLALRLEGNQFEGGIPNFQQKNLTTVNVSNNYLEGPIPERLSMMDVSSFAGNEGLCGKPLESCDFRKFLLELIMIILCILIAIAIIGIVVAILRRQGQTEELGKVQVEGNQKASCEGDKVERGVPPQMPGSGRKAENGRLVFLRDDRERFDLNDLLKASAEVLGSGNFGSSYKAVLLTGSAMVVKRFRQMNNVGREEFQEHMRRIGRLRHPNLLPIVAYYYRKEEKLLITDFVENGSLASVLHGNRTPGQPGLDWPTRLNIIKEVTKGVAYLYEELPSLIVPHGHLKSSNVVLDESLKPLLTDYGLVPVINQEHASQLMVAYKSPEYEQHGRTTRKTDVWSLGVLIVEMLTGKFPASFLKQGKGGSDEDLVSWANSVVKQERPEEVFDKDMGETKNAEREMMKLLKIGLCCCEVDVEKRWDITEAAEKIEGVRERDKDDGFYSTFASEGDMISSKGMTEVDLSVL
ncbi:PREDICTED: pollen receptor-like kinase 1 [Nelumbo nucifera]|uniref:non-specific serine/threonine protein kinase n=2 Tax=Nelumbo nucifera TaxID=4432 RepID=A0A1U8A7T8_NELNU|nr:PREDICTED: pollen receptor-like kinase 1 [Nelumbo nucifera]DAD46232.1 TPA_asm: hypothetical protein HUJ06_004462 [Nelumbo nucifera]